MSMLHRVRILPLLVLVAGICLIIRTGEFAAGMKQAGAAFAQQEVAAEPPPLPAKPGEEVKLAEAKFVSSEKTAPGEPVDGPIKQPAEKPSEAAAAAEAEAAKEGPAPPAAEGGEKVEWQDSTEADFDYSQVKADIYKDLVARRDALDKREGELATREAILEAAERELDQKIREMTAVRNEIESMMKQQSEEEQTRVSTLVKIYEGMKAKDAARIFNTLDMDVLIAVMSRMSERKSAPILAEMAPERARSVTILLAQQKQLPEIPPQ